MKRPAGDLAWMGLKMGYNMGELGLIFFFFLRLGGFLAGVGCVIRDNLGYYWPGSWLYL